MRPNSKRRKLSDVPVPNRIVGDSTVSISGITHDSRRVRRGDLYAALPGANTHGARFVSQAIELGAAAVLTDAIGAELIGGVAQPPVPIVVVDDVRDSLGPVSAWVFGYPSQELTVIGITGTNGKTTTATLTQAALAECGLATGLLGTVANRFGSIVFPGSRTTPEAPDLQAMLAVMKDNGADAVVMEVSSHALDLKRVRGVEFDVAVFTNLSHDHLDFHHTMDAYFQAKAQLFQSSYSAFGLICIDDQWGRLLAEQTRIPFQTYGVSAGDWAPPTWRAEAIRRSAGGSAFRVVGPDMSGDAGCRLPGDFNVANALAAIAVSQAVAVRSSCAIRGVAQSVGVPGRMQLVDASSPADDVAVFVDYAHTPEAIERSISVGRVIANERGGRVLVGLGCGGDRDAHKRAEMGAVAAELADVLVITDDNPRSEDPAMIRQAILAGVRSVSPSQRALVREIGDRREALRYLVSEAEHNDVVLALGKGHETTQEIAGRFHHFDDAHELAQALRGDTE